MKYRLLIIPILALSLVGVFTVNVGAETRVQKTPETTKTETEDNKVSVCVVGQESECNDQDSTSSNRQEAVGTEKSSTTTRPATANSEKSGTSQKANAESAKERAQVKLESKKLEVCKKRQEVMKNTMTRMEDRSSKHIAWLDSVVEKIKSFYSANSLTVANYDTLLANIATTRATAVSSEEQLGQYQQEFSCDGNDPKSVINDFKTQHQSQIDAVKAYKEAVKAFAEAVKSAAEASGQNTTDTTNNTTGGTN